MKRPLLLLALLACAAPLGMLAPLSAARAAPPVTASKSEVPPIPFTERRLANGLRVLTVRDASTPNVSVQVWYGVGSKDDPQGRSGFAHLFEHMMFKATRDMPSENLDRLTEDVGGSNNAFTEDDLTAFHEIIPANHLERLLWAEAERMSSLSVDQPNFVSERAVVEEELRQSYLANPYGRLELGIHDASYAIHPYKRSTIGSIGDLDAATLPDVKAFHDTFYRPDNATLIVVGNFEPAQLDGWIDRYFAAIGHPASPIPRVTVVEPPRAGPRAVTYYAPNVPLPAADITWPIPAAAGADLPALKVADAILSTGESSRLQHDLVYEQELAESINSDAGSNQQPSLFQVQAVMAGDKPLDAGVAALQAEVKRLRDTPVAASELARAKNQLIAINLRERETSEGEGMLLGQATALEGDPHRADVDLAAIQAVTAADVQRVADKYLQDDRQVVIRYLDESKKPAGLVQPDLAQTSPHVDALPLSTTIAAAPPPASLPHAPPPVSAPLPSTPPKIAERTLPNGMRVIVAKTSDLPIVTAALTMKRGAASDARGQAGAIDLATELLPKGTTTLSATDIAQKIEAAGGALEPQSNYDDAGLTLTALADQLPATLPLLSDVARRPAFAPAEIERLRRQKLDEFTVAYKEPRGLASLAVAPAVFGAGSPEGHAIAGSPAFLRHLTAADIRAAYAAAYRPDDAILVMTGDIEPEAGFALAQKAFGDWAKPSAPLEAAPVRAAPATPRVTVIDLPAAGQASVTLAAPTIARADPRYFAVRVANAVLGGGYSARLNEEVRIKRGLSYGASSQVAARRDDGLFTASAQTKNASVPEVAALLTAEARKLGREPIPPEELEARKSSLIGGYGRTIETSAGLAAVLTSDALYGVDLKEVATYPMKVQAVDAAAAKAAAPTAIDADHASLIIVGDAKSFLPALKARFPDVRVVQAADLDLDAPGLTKTP